MNSLHINSLPPAQQPRMRPLKCGGGLVSLVTIHPSAEPMTKVQRMFNGINHLQIGDIQQLPTEQVHSSYVHHLQ